MDLEDWRAQGQPLIVSIKSIAFAFSAAANADKVLTAYLDKKPVAAVIRDLIEDLLELQRHLVASVTEEIALPLLSEDLLESDWIMAEIIDGKLWLRDRHDPAATVIAAP